MEQVKACKEDSATGHLVASKTIQQGDVVLYVPTLVSGPGRGKPAVQESCQLTPDESQILKNEKCDAASFTESNNDFDFILPLRVAKLVKSNTDLKEILKKEKLDVKSIMKICKEKYAKSDQNIREKLAKFKVFMQILRE